jgi:hypothetical protein
LWAIADDVVVVVVVVAAAKRLVAVIDVWNRIRHHFYDDGFVDAWP